MYDPGPIVLVQADMTKCLRWVVYKQEFLSSQPEAGSPRSGAGKASFGVSLLLGCRLLTCILTWRELREEASSHEALMSIHLIRRLHLHRLPKASPLNHHIGGWGFNT